VAVLADTHKKIVGLDITVDDLSFVEVLNSIDHLLTDEEGSF
jgi:hypothetical protein